MIEYMKCKKISTINSLSAGLKLTFGVKVFYFYKQFTNHCMYAYLALVNI